MRVLRHFAPIPADARGAVLALGNFDGVHLGHQAVIARAGEIARGRGAPHGIVTFEPHPRQFFRPDDPPFRLTPFRVKMRAVEALGCALAVSLHFDATLARQSADDFVIEVLHRGLGAAELVVGYDFVFGAGRGGDAALLARLGRDLGFGVTVLDPVAAGEGIVVSSTEIRDLLVAGEPRRAAALLGRPWEIDGRVETGDRRGRTIGFPTANIALADYLRPRAGVYAVRAGIEHDGGVDWHGGVANIGTRPTVNGTDLRLEAHLLDFSGDLYGRHLRIRLLDWIRPETRFPSFEALKAQIAQDAVQARALLARA